ncbi:MAG: hypothetical protein L6Q54_12990 [Leptospiraceae bacterium]|nr:hypothetical protein [Leptospiraceae bacterium]MCK6382150.1 hypothetical protein [Leptospiraceae bacterium]NUM40429.1 hypothetical protein [Leptospiraceae bacterium]
MKKSLTVFILFCSLANCNRKLDNFLSPEDPSFRTMQFLYCLTGLDSVFCPKIPVSGILHGVTSNSPIVGAKIIFSDGVLRTTETNTDLSGGFRTTSSFIKFNVSVLSHKDVKIGSFGVEIQGDYSISISNVSSGLSVSFQKNSTTTYLNIGVEEKTFYSFMGSSSNDILYSVIQAKDGGYLLAGEAGGLLSNLSSSPIINFAGGALDCLIVKLNSSGTVEWHTFLGGTGIDSCNGIIQTRDEGFIAFGYANSITSISGKTPLKPFLGAGKNGAIYKLSKSGSLEWFSFLGDVGPTNVDIKNVVQDSSGYVIGGVADTTITTYPGITTIVSYTSVSDAFLLKIKENGDGEWVTYSGGSSTDTMATLKSTSDGGFVTTGSAGLSFSIGGVSAKNPFGGGGDIFVAKYNSSGILQWFTFLGGTGADSGNSIALTQDNGFIIAGNSGAAISSLAGLTPIRSHSGSSGNCVAIKLSSDGNPEWFTFSSAPSIINTCTSVEQLPDRSYIFSGTSGGNFSSLDGVLPDVLITGGGSSDSFVMKMNERGVVQWYSVIGSAGADTGNSILNTADGGHFLVGQISGNISSIGSKTPLFPYSSFSDGLFYKIRADGKF